MDGINYDKELNKALQNLHLKFINSCTTTLHSSINSESGFLLNFHIIDASLGFQAYNLFLQMPHIETELEYLGLGLQGFYDVLDCRAHSDCC